MGIVSEPTKFEREWEGGGERGCNRGEGEGGERGRGEGVKGGFKGV